MADQKAASTTSTPTTTESDHDRVAMLSIAKDGSFDQHDPEIIGDKDFALDATKRQFAERAASAIDVEARAAVAGDAGGEEVSQDPFIESLKKDQDKAIAAAEKKAESTVNSLHQG